MAILEQHWCKNDIYAHELIIQILHMVLKREVVLLINIFNNLTPLQSSCCVSSLCTDAQPPMIQK